MYTGENFFYNGKNIYCEGEKESCISVESFCKIDLGTDHHTKYHPSQDVGKSLANQ